MTSPAPRHPAYDLKNDELRALCRRYGVNPRSGLSRALRDDLLTWVIVNRLIERRDTLLAQAAADRLSRSSESAS